MLVEHALNGVGAVERLPLIWGVLTQPDKQKRARCTEERRPREVALVIVDGGSTSVQGNLLPGS